MSEIIDKELEYAREKFCFDIIKDENGVERVALTRRNVALAEAMIMNNSSYLKSFDENQGPKGDYGGSTAYWMKKLKGFYDNNGDLKKDMYDQAVFLEVLKGAIRAVDRENSTHLNADGVGVDQISDRLFEKKENLVKCFSELTRGFELIKDISKETNPNGDRVARKNYSFATKFCHYGSFYFFDDERKDNYSIYDGVMEKALPFYLRKYGITSKKKGLKGEFKCYSTYLDYVGKVIDAVYKETGEKISRNGFDHLIWYYYKGRI